MTVTKIYSALCDSTQDTKYMHIPLKIIIHRIARKKGKDADF